MRSIICLAAQGVIRNAEDNNISVFNILEGITVEGFPLYIPQVTFFVLLERTLAEEGHVVGHFAATLSGRNIHELDVDINFQGQLRNRVIMSIRGLVLPNPGTLSFSLTFPTGLSANYVVEANAVAGAEAQASPSLPPQANA